MTLGPYTRQWLDAQYRECEHEDWRAGYCLCGEQLYCELPPWPSYDCELSGEWPQPWEDRANSAGFAVQRYLQALFPDPGALLEAATRPSPLMRQLVVSPKAYAALEEWAGQSPERFVLRGRDGPLTGPQRSGTVRERRSNTWHKAHQKR